MERKIGRILQKISFVRFVRNWFVRTKVSIFFEKVVFL